MNSNPEQKLPEQEQGPTRHEAIAAEIIAMAKADQDMREKNIAEEKLGKDFWDSQIDIVNTERMKALVAEIGWPSVSKVGQEASLGAWLLVQHADRDPDFQEYCLSLMKELPESEVSRADIAMLTDRVRIRRGQPQVYGTQFNQIDGAHVPLSIEDPEHVNERRAAMGLDTLEENIARMYEKYPLDKAKE